MVGGGGGKLSERADRGKRANKTYREMYRRSNTKDRKWSQKTHSHIKSLLKILK